MIWIVIYLLVGVLLGVLWMVHTRPYTVTVGDVIVAPFLLLIWPGVAVFIAAEYRLLERGLFTIGGNRHDDED